MKAAGCNWKGYAKGFVTGHRKTEKSLPNKLKGITIACVYHCCVNAEGWQLGCAPPPLVNSRRWRCCASAGRCCRA
eukprot:84038-Chlamydomonas_euryale.AAC.7